MRATDLPCPAPDRTPRPPRVSMPAGACDTHAHVCGPAARFSYAPARIYTPPDAPLDDYLHLLRVLGIARAVLVQPSVYGTDNAALVDALYRCPRGLRGVAVVAPAITPAELCALDAVGIRGVRFNLVDHDGERNVVPLDVVRTLARAIAEHGWHIEFLVNLDEAPGFAQAVVDLPVDVVVGHLGYPRSLARWSSQGDSLDAFLRLYETGRCWVKLTGPYRISTDSDLPYADVAPLARRLAEVNPDRLLWGTDWPHVMNKKPMPNDGDLTDLIAGWLPDAALRARVLVDNPSRLYGFASDERLPQS